MMRLIAWAVLGITALVLVGGGVFLNAHCGWMPSGSGNPVKSLTNLADVLLVVLGSGAIFLLVSWAVLTVSGEW